MRRGLQVLAVAAALLGASPVAADVAADPAGEAKAFVVKLYGAYHGNGPDYLGRNAAQVFSPRLLALIRRDRALTPKGDVGALDGDPICDCQDFGISKLAVAVRPMTPDHAQATVRFVNLGTPETVRLDLVSGAAGWRIDNIHTRTTPDLAIYLQTHAGGR